MMGVMACQLVLIYSSDTDWRLDEQTKELGRRGVLEARATLQRVTSAPSVKMGAQR